MKDSLKKLKAPHPLTALRLVSCIHLIVYLQSNANKGGALCPQKGFNLEVRKQKQKDPDSKEWKCTYTTAVSVGSGWQTCHPPEPVIPKVGSQ